MPFFFVGTGMSMDVRSLVEPSTLLQVPIFLGALLLARALPAVVYFPRLRRWRHVAAAGLLQATSLSIPVVGGQIGVNLGLIRPANYVALVAAGLVSVVLFPQLAMVLTRTEPLPPDAHEQILPSQPGGPRRSGYLTFLAALRVGLWRRRLHVGRVRTHPAFGIRDLVPVPSLVTTTAYCTRGLPQPRITVPTSKN